MNIRDYNRDAWDREVKKNNKWTIPVSAETIARARQDDWQIVLTPTIPVPVDWFPQLKGADVLCLASGGGQQGPVLAATGANVTVLDNSPLQLEQDRLVAQRDGLSIRLIEGDMADLRMFDSMSYDLIVHPVSNTFVPDVRSVPSATDRGYTSGRFCEPCRLFGGLRTGGSYGRAAGEIPHSLLRHLRST